MPPLYTHPFDPDDSHYVNLAVATNSRLIVSRDRHLLNLMDRGRTEARDFMMLFPTLTVTTPDALCEQLKKDDQQE